MPILKLQNASEPVKVPDAEFQVLTVLFSLKEAHGPAISRASKGSISVAAVYKLLSRLENRGLVHKREEQVQVGDITAKRVFYKVHEAVIWSSIGTENEANKAAATARRADYSPVQEVGVHETSPRAFPS